MYLSKQAANWVRVMMSPRARYFEVYACALDKFDMANVISVHELLVMNSQCSRPKEWFFLHMSGIALCLSYAEYVAAAQG